MEAPSLPFHHSLLAILRDIELDFLLLHESRENRLVDRVVCTRTSEHVSLIDITRGLHVIYIPSTMRTLIRGTILVSLGFPFFCAVTGAEAGLSKFRLGLRADGDGVAREGEPGGSGVCQRRGSTWLLLRDTLRDDVDVDDEGSPMGEPAAIPAEMGLSVDNGGKFSPGGTNFRLPLDGGS